MRYEGLKKDRTSGLFAKYFFFFPRKVSPLWGGGGGGVHGNPVLV